MNDAVFQFSKPDTLRPLPPFLFLLPFFLFQTLQAAAIPPAPSSWVNDYAGLLAASEREELDAKLAAVEKQTGAQIFFAIFPTLENESLEDFSIRLAQQWKLGRRGRDNGVLLSLFMKERRIRIEVGYGLEEKIPDIVAGRIIRGMAPYFRQNDYSGGLNYAADELVALAGDAAAPEPLPSQRGNSFPWPVVLMLILIFSSFLRAGIPRRATSGFRIDRRGRYRNSIPWWLPLMVGSHRKGGHFGGGGGGGFGGGFGGGGGGRFGGGGASGGW